MEPRASALPRGTAPMNAYCYLPTAAFSRLITTIQLYFQ